MYLIFMRRGKSISSFTSQSLRTSTEESLGFSWALEKRRYRRKKKEEEVEEEEEDVEEDVEEEEEVQEMKPRQQQV